MNLFKDRTIRRYIFKNAIEEIPVLGKEVFIKDAQKVIPSLDVSDLKFAEGYGGMRPQIIDKERQELLLGEAKISKDGIIFNMTPSPGATSSLSIAMQDAQAICQHLSKSFDLQKHQSEIQMLKINAPSSIDSVKDAV